MPAGWKVPTPAMRLAEEERKEHIRLREQRERFVLAAMQGILNSGIYVPDVAEKAVFIADATINRMNATN